ncbi:hypothetical protein [Streptomyces sp. NPDC056160]|uniref:hypothetical protein n=1 Tax=Streptomyces sp. NPDC056160 TaxID=3345731 RepID=UPI0035DF7DB3
MRHARRGAVRRMTRLTALGALLPEGAMPTRAAAADAAPVTSVTSRATASSGAGRAPGAELMTALGTGRTAGGWVGADGRTVIAVTDHGGGPGPAGRRRR